MHATDAPSDPAAMPEYLFCSALSLEQRGEMEDACELYLQTMRVAPNHARAQYRVYKLFADRAERAGSQLARPSQCAPKSPQRAPMISVVICSVDAQKFAAASANYRQLLEGYNYEIVGIHDARSLCEGYNRGFALSRGDIVVFSHDDIEILSSDLAAKLVEALRDRDVVGVAGSMRFPETGKWGLPIILPHTRGLVAHRAPGEDAYAVYVFGVDGAVDDGIQVLDGVFFAARRKVLEAIEFDARTFDGFHFYDIDFTYRAFLAGFRVAVANDLCLVHQSRGKFDSHWRSYADRFLAKHRDVRRPAVVAHRFWGPYIARLRTAAAVVDFSNSVVAAAEAARRLGHGSPVDRER